MFETNQGEFYFVATAEAQLNDIGSPLLGEPNVRDKHLIPFY